MYDYVRAKRIHAVKQIIIENSPSFDLQNQGVKSNEESQNKLNILKPDTEFITDTNKSLNKVSNEVEQNDKNSLDNDDDGTEANEQAQISQQSIGNESLNFFGYSTFFSDPDIFQKIA